MLGHWLRFRSMLSWLCIAPNPSTDRETCHANLNRNYPRSKFEISANTHTRKYNNIQSSCLNAIYHCSRNMDLKLFKCMWSKFIYKCSSFDRKCILKTLYGKVGLFCFCYTSVYSLHWIPNSGIKMRENVDASLRGKALLGWIRLII